MYYDDHNPPHFHAYYSGQQALFRIDTLQLMEGELPKRAKALILEWAAEHRDALEEDWQLARDHHPLKVIPPLE